jgi:hypothetical protein
MTPKGSPPPPAKLDRVRRLLTPGRVVKLYCDFTDPPKDKLLIILAVSTDTAVFVISSRLTRFAERKAHLRACHVLMPAATHAFLDHDSYVNSAEVVSIKTKVVEEQLLHDTRRIVGTVHADTVRRIREVVQISPTIVDRMRRIILENLPGDPTE